MALVVSSGRARTVDQLIDDLWADGAPPTARSSLHNLLTRLRRLLGPELLTTTGNAYRLVIGDDQLDIRVFEQLVGRSMAERGETKVHTLDTALALWRGEPLLDLRYENFAQGEIRRLEELHVLALEERVAAQLELGAHAAVVPQLQQLVLGFPFRERLRHQLMLALHLSGRTVEALATYESWRCLLVESWAIEPGAEIEQLSNDIRGNARSAVAVA